MEYQNRTLRDRMAQVRAVRRAASLVPIALRSRAEADHRQRLDAPGPTDSRGGGHNHRFSAARPNASGSLSTARRDNRICRSRRVCRRWTVASTGFHWRGSGCVGDQRHSLRAT